MAPLPPPPEQPDVDRPPSTSSPNGAAISVASQETKREERDNVGLLHEVHDIEEDIEKQGEGIPNTRSWTVAEDSVASLQQTVDSGGGTGDQGGKGKDSLQYDVTEGIDIDEVLHEGYRFLYWQGVFSGTVPLPLKSVRCLRWSITAFVIVLFIIRIVGMTADFCYLAYLFLAKGHEGAIDNAGVHLVLLNANFAMVTLYYMAVRQSASRQRRAFNYELSIWFRGTRMDPRYNRKGRRILVINFLLLALGVFILSTRRVLFILKPVEEGETFNDYYTPSKGTERSLYNIRFGLVREIISDLLFLSGSIVSSESIGNVAAGCRYRMERLSVEIKNGQTSISELVQACDDASTALRRLLYVFYGMIANSGINIVVLIATLALSGNTATVTQLMIVPAVLIFVIATLFSGVWSTMTQHVKSSHDIIQFREEGRNMLTYTRSFVITGKSKVGGDTVTAGEGAAPVDSTSTATTGNQGDDVLDLDGVTPVVEVEEPLPPWNALDDASDDDWEAIHGKGTGNDGSKNKNKNKGMKMRGGRAKPGMTHYHHADDEAQRSPGHADLIVDAEIFERSPHLFRPKLRSVYTTEVLSNLWHISSTGILMAVPVTALILPALIIVTPLIVRRALGDNSKSILEQSRAFAYIEALFYAPVLVAVPWALIILGFGRNIIKKGGLVTGLSMALVAAVWGVLCTAAGIGITSRSAVLYTIIALSFLFYAWYLYRYTSIDIHWTYLYTAGGMATISVVYVLYLIPWYAQSSDTQRLIIQLGVHAPLRTLLTVCTTIIYPPLRRISKEYNHSITLTHGLSIMMITLNRLLIANVASLTSQAFLAVLVGAVELAVRITAPVNMVMFRALSAHFRPHARPRVGYKQMVLEVDYILRHYVSVSRHLLKMQAEYTATIFSLFVSLIYRGVHMRGESLLTLAGVPLLGALVQVTVEVLIDFGSLRFMSNWQHMPLLPVYHRFWRDFTFINLVGISFLVAVLSSAVVVVSGGF